jgi:ABC-type transport system involved in multi-copper enzyme maturation permease subunit
MIRAIGISPTSVIKKDLRLRMRGWRWAGVTTVYVAILGIITVGFLLQKYTQTPSQSSQAGIELFQSLSIFQLLLIVFVTPASMAGAISGERQHRTWDLLLVSRLSALDIVLGKFLVGIAFNLLLLAASLPLFSLIYLFGGVALGDVIHAFIVFLVTVLFLGAVSLAVSALTARLVVSFMVSMLIALSLAVGLSLLTLYLQSPGQPGVVTLAGIPFQSSNTPSPLTPFAQLDPVVALLSTLPSDAGGPLLGGIGTIDHAFGLPWQLPLWGAYALLAGAISFGLLLLTIGLVQRPSGTLRWHNAGGSQ